MVEDFANNVEVIEESEICDVIIARNLKTRVATVRLLKVWNIEGEAYALVTTTSGHPVGFELFICCANEKVLI